MSKKYAKSLQELAVEAMLKRKEEVRRDAAVLLDLALGAVKDLELEPMAIMTPYDLARALLHQAALDKQRADRARLERMWRARSMKASGSAGNGVPAACGRRQQGG
jgi:hypothetical protein